MSVTIRNFLYTEKNLLVNFTFFIRKFIIFIVTLGHTQNVGFLLFQIVLFKIFIENFTFLIIIFIIFVASFTI